MLIDLPALLHGWGPWVLLGIGLMVFVESGLLLPFLPGDSLLFTAGMLHMALGVDVWVLTAVIVGAAALGSAVGYVLGVRFGHRLFKADARVLTPARLHQAESFFTRYGGRSIVLARFVPVVRTFLPLVAGAVEYPRRRFVAWNVLGALLWGGVLVAAGVWLGHVPWIEHNIEFISLGIVAASLVPVMLHLLPQRATVRVTE